MQVVNEPSDCEGKSNCELLAVGNLLGLSFFGPDLRTQLVLSI
jgi:hypothetical protein